MDLGGLNARIITTQTYPQGPPLRWMCVCVGGGVGVCSVTQSCPTLWDPRACSLPGSSVHGILQAGILEWVVISFSRDRPNPGTEPRSLVSPILAGVSLTLQSTNKSMCLSVSQSMSAHVHAHTHTHTHRHRTCPS